MFHRNSRAFTRITLSKDYYSTLGLKHGAAPKEIRAAYLTLAKQYHPDAPSGNTEKFKQIAEAYEVLNDPRTKEASKLQQQRSQSPPRKEERRKNQHYQYEHQENPNREQQEARQEEWKNNKQWSYSHREQEFTAHGYEYHDPFLNQTGRYTYSQFKKDKYYRTYKRQDFGQDENKEKEKETKFRQRGKEGSNGFVIFGTVAAVAVFSGINVFNSPSPQIYAKTQKNRF